MPKIYDNIENNLAEGLNETLAVSVRADLCVGYFNLRGWKEIGNTIEQLSGSEVEELEHPVHRCCRLLVGMQKLPADIVKEHYWQESTNSIDQAQAIKLKKRLAEEFKEQLTCN